ncbi:MAG: T9SS type A sorting domain-containing protein [Flavobacteriales bacterium]|nr:T9SS type A sorting domain-containing protein [Flavobacteriales bacterium]
MKHGTLLSYGLPLLLGSASLTGLAQYQTGYPANGLAGNLHALDLAVGGPNTCGPYAFTMVNPGTAWGTTYGAVPSYFNVQAGSGPQQLQLQFHYEISSVAPAPTYQFWIDGQFCSSCTVQLTAHVPGFSWDPNISIYTDVLTITHQAGDAWAAPNNGVREFGLRVNLFGQPNCEARFKAVMVGTTFSRVLGYYDAPALPLYILRDPPGDGSYSTITITDGACVGSTTSVTTGSTQDAYFKARVGVAGTVPFIGLEYDIYGEIGTDYHASQTEQQNFDITTCFQNTQVISTGATGPPDDVFIGSSVRYAYGFGQVITRTACGTIEKDAYFANGPVGVNSSYAYTESQIRNSIIPDQEDLIAGLTPGTSGYRDAVSQLGVWVQTLAMNDSIKAAAVVDEVESFGGGLSEDHTYTTTTTEARSISYEATVDSGFTGEFGVNIGGTGVTAGGGMHFQQGYGSGQNSSNSVENTMAYHLADDDGSDQFTVNIAKDPVFGTFVFRLDSASAETSCPYEGGEQVDQPSLSVGSPGQTNMIVDEATIGSQVIFPLYICNNSAQDRTYHLKFSSATNTSGAIMNAFGNTLNGNDDGIALDVLAGDCLNVTNLLLEQPNINVVNFENILLYLYSLCDPSISSSVTISAYFGTGNVAPDTYCKPPSQGEIQDGFYVDGVQLGDIENLNTGGTPPPTGYVDYSADNTATLSRNSEQMITITAGPGDPIQLAAWIDYDHSGTYDADEKIGEGAYFLVPGDRRAFHTFQVPAAAQLGITRMRVRAVHVLPGEPTPMDPCYAYLYSEIEEYEIVIDGNTPLDCTGAPNGSANPGYSCNDGNSFTVFDFYQSNCTCAGFQTDCNGVVAGPALPGTPCDDGNANTGNDVFDAGCGCAGLPFDCLGVAGGPDVPGMPCNDFDQNTVNDMLTANCACIGQLYDCAGTLGGTALPGSPCDDGNPLSGGDLYDANCLCAGAFATDCAGIPGGTAQPGTPCDDGNAATGNDVYGLNCACAGLPFDCAGTPGGTQTPGTPCDDGNPNSSNDTFTANCGCIGVLSNDCAGVPGGTAQAGTACDDGDATTGNDVYNAFCTCAGQLIDCDGVVGGFALPGFPCDDANTNTGNDVIDANRQCDGLLIDCEGVPGGTSTIGTACDDGDNDTSNDMFNANCICAGMLASDCEGTVGGTAQPGTACDDGNANTGNDVYSANCTCAGEVIDCEGTIGGPLLPGSACDDGNVCTVNDLRDANCACSGTTLTIGAVSGATVVLGNTTNAYVVTPVPNATSYTWSLPNGWSTADNSAFAVVADANNVAGPVDLCVAAMVGACELTSCITVTVDISTDIHTNDGNANEWFTVQPNPSNGWFQLRLSTTDATPIRISVRNSSGQEVLAPLIVAGHRAIDMDLGEVAPGAYYLLATRDEEQTIIKLMVQR